jgi:hypothetical protein
MCVKLGSFTLPDLVEVFKIFGGDAFIEQQCKVRPTAALVLSLRTGSPAFCAQIAIGWRHHDDVADHMLCF